MTDLAVDAADDEEARGWLSPLLESDRQAALASRRERVAEMRRLRAQLDRWWLIEHGQLVPGGGQPS